MKPGQNFNRPKKGSNITVDPIRSIKDLQAISKLTRSNPRNHLLFIMGINNGLRTGDLLKLKVKDVSNLKCGDVLKIREGKTGKTNVLVINKLVFKALKLYKEKIIQNESNYLFQSRKGRDSISIQTVNHLIKQWTKTIHLKGNFGAHSLRKTWGFIQRTEHGVGYEIIAKRFNHSSPAITMRYLGIQDKEIHKTLMTEIG